MRGIFAPLIPLYSLSFILRLQHDGVWYIIEMKEGVIMNWDKSQMASSAFARGSGGMSLGEQWSLAAFLRDTGNSAKSSKRTKTVQEIIEEDRKRAEDLKTLGFDNWDLSTLLNR